MTNRSWRVDETYLKIAGKWTYLYRSIPAVTRSIFCFLRSAMRMLPSALSRKHYSHQTILGHESSTWTGIPPIRARSMNSSGLENSVDAAAVGPFAI
jgi:DDE domain